MEMLVAIDAIDDLAHEGKRRRLRPEEVHIDREALRLAIARLRASMKINIPDVVTPQLGGPIGRLERIWADGAVKGDRVTVNQEAVYDELDQARQLGVADVRRQLGYPPSSPSS